MPDLPRTLVTTTRPELPTEPSESCGTCRHARKNPHDITGRALECWRLPPLPVPVNQGGQMGVMAIRPPVARDSACGEFAAVAH